MIEALVVLALILSLLAAGVGLFALALAGRILADLHQRFPELMQRE